MTEFFIKNILAEELLQNKIDKHKENISKSLKGKTKGIPKSIEQKEKISNTLKNRPKLTCPICNKTMDPGNFKRYGHGQNCKIIL